MKTTAFEMPAISTKMAADKLDHALASGASVLAGGDLGCLMHIAGLARRRGHDIEVRHIAELLTGDVHGPGIGDGENRGEDR